MLAFRFVQPNRQVLRTVVARNGARTIFRPIGRPPSLAVSQRLRSYATEQKQGEKEHQEGAKEDAFRDQGATDTRQSTQLWTDSPFFVALLIVGTGLIAYGAYGLYAVMTMWPEEVRSDLRSGLRAKRKGDIDSAFAYLSRAWETARSLPLERFGEDPLLKETGIGIVLGGLLEDCNKLKHAYNIYEETLWLLRTAHLNVPPSNFDSRPDLGVETLKGLTKGDRMRAVALSYKLAEIAQNLGKSPQEEEKWLVWGVEATLRTVLDAPPMAAVDDVRTVGQGHWEGAEGSRSKVLVEQLGLPAWTTRLDIAAPFEALGTFYAKSGNITYALPLYLQAISILLPPTPNVVPVEDKCRGAQLMGNVAELMIRSLNTENASSESLSQAEAWAKKGLDVVMAARKLSPIKYDVCEESLAMLLYNVAMIRELSGDKVQARVLLSEALEQSKAISMDEGIKRSQEGLRALDEGKEGFKSSSMEMEGKPEKSETS